MFVLVRPSTFSTACRKAKASFKPEAFSEIGIPGYDDQTVDLGPIDPGQDEAFVQFTAFDLIGGRSDHDFEVFAHIGIVLDLQLGL